jgi:hypothetical protein
LAIAEATADLRKSMARGWDAQVLCRGRASADARKGGVSRCRRGVLLPQPLPMPGKGGYRKPQPVIASCSWHAQLPWGHGPSKLQAGVHSLQRNLICRELVLSPRFPHSCQVPNFHLLKLVAQPLLELFLLLRPAQRGFLGHSEDIPSADFAWS